jgi:hypothetical protein
LSLAKAAARKLKRPKGTYRLTVALHLSDSGGGAVSYNLTIINPVTLVAVARKSGTTSATSIAWTPVIKQSRRTAALRLEVDASDQVGNRTQLEHTIPVKT